MVNALNYIRTNNQAQRKLTIFLMMAVLLCCLQFTSLTPVYSSDTETGTGSDAVTSTNTGGATTDTGGTITFDNWGEKGENAVTNTVNRVGTISLGLAALAALGGLIGLMFSKDPRNTSMWIKFLFKVAAVLFFIFLVNEGVAKTLIKSLANKFG